MTPTSLNSVAREAALEALRRSSAPGAELDVLVIGGGATGAGVALDAASRGLRTALVEKDDWASGTSSRSSKLIHGGLRYLEMFDFKLVHEALTERDRLMTRIAPHLVRPVPFLYPLRKRVWDRCYVGAGILLYELLASTRLRRRSVPFHRHLSARGARHAFPSLGDDSVIGAIQYWDASVDDARLVLSLVRTAAGHGALTTSRTLCTEFTRDPSGRVDGAVLLDRETGTSFPVRARHVIAATGVWTEEIQRAAEADAGLSILASKGAHVSVPRDRIKGDIGMILRTEKSVLFIIPWDTHWLIGTTDTPWLRGPDGPTVEAEDIEYILERANAVLDDPLTPDDVVGTFAGLRPLLQTGTKAGTTSAKVSREHTVAEAAPGLTVIAGGKLTTYRIMAEDAVDFALGEGHPASRTATLPLVGAGDLRLARRRLRELAREYSWEEPRVERLLARYGSLISDLAELIATDATLAAPLEHAPDYLRVEAVYAVVREGALHLEDILSHRLRLSYESPDAGAAAAPEIATLVAPWIGWTDEDVREELARYADQARQAHAPLAAMTNRA